MLSFLPASVFLIHSLIAFQTATGSIEGQVLLPDGKPAEGVRIAVMPAEIAPVVAVPTLMNIAATDASGRYKLTGISPGRYYVVAGVAASPTYFPGTELAKADVLTVKDGASTENISFSLLRGVRFKVRGRVIDSSGNRPLPKVMLSSARFDYVEKFEAEADSAGFFEFRDIRPGSYFLIVAFPNRGGVVIRSVVVEDRDLTDVGLRVLRQIEVSGHIVVQSGEPPPLTPLVQADLPSTFVGTDDERMADSFQRSQGIRTILPNADGSFKLILASGEHQIVVKRLPAEYEVKTIRRGSQDLLRQTLKLETAPITDLEIVIARKGDSAPLR